MRLTSIAMRNVRRHLGRNMLLLMVITMTVGVVVTLYLVTRTAERDLANKVDAYGANIVVVPRTKQLPLTYSGVQVGGFDNEAAPLHMFDVTKIRSIKNKQNINKVAPKLVEPVIINGTRTLAVGVQWGQELPLKRWWKLTGVLPSKDHDALLGSRAMARLAVRVGDTLEIKGERFRVVSGLGPTGTQEDDLVYLDLATVQRLWNRADELSFIEVSAWCSSCPIEQINAQISTEMPYARVSAVLKAAESRRILIGQFQLFGLVLSGLMILVGCLIVLTTTLAGVRERRGEIGIFRSIGYRRKHIFKVILIENLAVALAGSGLGIALASLVAGTMARALAQVQTVLAPSPLILGLSLVLSLLVVLAASAYPAARAAQLSPTLAMRRV